MVDFETHPQRYRHWKLIIEPPRADLILDVDASAGLDDGYELKLNSYDLGVDIELSDAVQRLRFEHPEVKVAVLRSAHPSAFCAGANIGMLARASHAHKVNFCKFTNETRLAMEDASAHSGLKFLAALDATATGGGYELALAADYILLVDDGNAAVSLPEVPSLGVLPGTGGLTRLVDKRKVRRDLADVFCTLEEGVRGPRAVEWGLVDETVARSEFECCVRERALELVADSERSEGSEGEGVELSPLDKVREGDHIRYRYVRVQLDEDSRVARLELRGPDDPPPADVGELLEQGAACWPLQILRELDDAVLNLRFNAPRLGTLIIKSRGDLNAVLAHDEQLRALRSHWLGREIMGLAKRVMKRLDVTSRTLIALVDPGSCFGGLLAEVLFVADRTYMRDAEEAPPRIAITETNFGLLPTLNGLSRLATRFLGDPSWLNEVKTLSGRMLDPREALTAGLITYAPDDIDWDEEIRLLIEERASFSPDALSGMEANLRFPGPETMESKIFGRLSAWQNWIFSRPNAVGPGSALSSYGTGRRPKFDLERT